MDAWERDEWAYYGVAVTIECNGLSLVPEYAHALWGIEGNYPGGDNSYFRVVANELLPDALDAARKALVKLCNANTGD